MGCMTIDVSISLNLKYISRHVLLGVIHTFPHKNSFKMQIMKERVRPSLKA